MLLCRFLLFLHTGTLCDRQREAGVRRAGGSSVARSLPSLVTGRVSPASPA